MTSRSDRVAGLDSNRSGPQFRPNELVDKHRAGTRLAPPSPLPTPPGRARGPATANAETICGPSSARAIFPTKELSEEGGKVVV